MGQLLPNLTNGSLVKLAEDSRPTKFTKLDNDHYSIGTGAILIRRDTFNERQWRASYGSGCSSRYIGYLLDNLRDGIWSLKLDGKVRECLVLVPIVVAEGNQVATLHTIYRKGFTLSCTEASVSSWQTGDKAFGYFLDNAKCITYLDETAAAVRWNLYSPHSLGGVAYNFNAGGTVDDSGMYRADFAPHPAFNLKSSIVVSDSADSDGYYTVENVPDNDGRLYVENNGL